MDAPAKRGAPAAAQESGRHRPFALRAPHCGRGWVVLILVRRRHQSSIARLSAARVPKRVQSVPDAPADLLAKPLSEAARRKSAATSAGGREPLRSRRREAQAPSAGRRQDFARRGRMLGVRAAIWRRCRPGSRSHGKRPARGWHYMRTKNYIEAAKIFRNQGDHLRAAQALELYRQQDCRGPGVHGGGQFTLTPPVARGGAAVREAARAYQPLLGRRDVTAGATPTVQDAFRPCSRSPGTRTRRSALTAACSAAGPDHRAAQAALQNLCLQPRLTGAWRGVQRRRRPIPLPGDDCECEFLEPGTRSAGVRARAPCGRFSPTPSLFELAREIEKDTALDQGDPSSASLRCEA